MSSYFVAKITARFAPFDFSVLLGFTNTIPHIEEWGDCLPIFKEDDGYSPIEHLIAFHKYMHQMGIFHEDVLMKMFMFYLEGDARQWYKYLPPGSVSYLR
jgi:hypothetical protein